MTTISQERSKLKAVGMTEQRLRSQWGARRSYTDSNPVIEPATKQFVHITITNPSAYNSDDAHAKAVEAIGISRFPNTGISYNRGVMHSGRIYEFQPMGRRGAHTVNDKKLSSCSTSGCPGRGSSLTTPGHAYNLNWNARAYVICQNVGDSVTDKMVDSLARIMAADRLAGMVTKTASIHGHRCAAWKGCPADKMWALMQALENKVNTYVKNGLQEEDEMQEADFDRIQKIAEAAARKAIGEASITITTRDGKKVKRSLKAIAGYDHDMAVANHLTNVEPTRNLTYPKDEEGNFPLISQRTRKEYEHKYSKEAALGVNEHIADEEAKEASPIVPLVVIADVPPEDV